MTLSEIAAGIEVTTEQHDRGAAVVDDTGVKLVDRLAAHADALPCTAAATATLVTAYTGGGSVSEAAREAEVAPMTAAKALHRCGIAGLCPLAPTRRGIVREWLDGRQTRSDAVALSGGDEAAFALTTYIETHDPVPEIAETIAAASEVDVGVGTLGGSLSLPDDLR